MWNSLKDIDLKEVKINKINGIHIDELKYVGTFYLNRIKLNYHKKCGSCGKLDNHLITESFGRVKNISTNYRCSKCKTETKCILNLDCTKYLDKIDKEEKLRKEKEEKLKKENEEKNKKLRESDSKAEIPNKSSNVAPAKYINQELEEDYDEDYDEEEEYDYVEDYEEKKEYVKPSYYTNQGSIVSNKPKRRIKKRYILGTFLLLFFICIGTSEEEPDYSAKYPESQKRIIEKANELFEKEGYSFKKEVYYSELFSDITKNKKIIENWYVKNISIENHKGEIYFQFQLLGSEIKLQNYKFIYPTDQDEYGLKKNSKIFSFLKENKEQKYFIIKAKYHDCNFLGNDPKLLKCLELLEIKIPEPVNKE